MVFHHLPKLVAQVKGTVCSQAEMVKDELLGKLGHKEWVHFCASTGGGGNGLSSAGGSVSERSETHQVRGPLARSPVWLLAAALMGLGIFRGWQ